MTQACTSARPVVLAAVTLRALSISAVEDLCRQLIIPIPIDSVTSLRLLEVQVAAAQHWGDLPEGSLGRRAWAAMRSAETAFKAASLLNFLVFLRYGRYRRATH